MPNVSSYTYLGVEFSHNGAWDLHIKKVVDTGKGKINKVHSIISNRDINLSARRLLLLSVIRPSIEYGSEIWEGNKANSNTLESIILKGAKKILGCSSKTCNEAVRGDMGLETLRGRRDKAKLKWWYKLVRMPRSRYAKQLLCQEWNAKPRRGRQRKMWGRVVEDIFKSLGINECEWLEVIKKEENSLASFMSFIEESIRERDNRDFEKGLDSKVKLEMYKTFGKNVEFKQYLHGISDAGTRLLFKFRSGTHGLNEELGRHRGREGRSQCMLCDDECESVAHVLWDCPAYVNIRKSFMEKLSHLLGSKYSKFLALNSVEKTSFVMGSELWDEHFYSLLSLVKKYIVDVWELRKLQLYGNDSCPSKLQSQCSTGNLGNEAKGKLGKLSSTNCTCVRGLMGGLAGGNDVNMHGNDSSVHCCGCVAYGSFAMAAC